MQKKLKYRIPPALVRELAQEKKTPRSREREPLPKTPVHTNQVKVPPRLTEKPDPDLIGKIIGV